MTRRDPARRDAARGKTARHEASGARRGASPESGVAPHTIRGVPEASCPFCGIAAGSVAAHVVHESAATIAFLDVRPVFPGHVLVVPRDHVATLIDADEPLVGALFGVVRHVANAVEAAMEAHGTFVAVNNKVSQSVPHLHVHVVPRRFKDGLRGFFWPRQRYDGDDHMASVAAAIRTAASKDAD